MGNINYGVTFPLVPNTLAKSSDINAFLNAITAQVNGNIDGTNISSLSGAKLIDGTITAAKLAGDIPYSLLAAGVGLPPGMVADFAGASAPTGWLLCDGTTVSRTTYAALFAVVSTTYNTGGEAGTDFRLPDYRGRVLIGKGTHTEVDALTDNDALSVGSRKLKHLHSLGTLATVATGSHSHTVSAHSHGIGLDGSHAHGPGHGGRFIYDQNNGPEGGVGIDASGSSYSKSTSTTTEGSHNHGGGTNNASPGTDAQGSHSHTLSGSVGDTTGPADGPAYHVTNKIIKT